MSEVRLAWKRRTVVFTGPATFYVAVPIVGRVPETRIADALLAEIQEACRGAAPWDGVRIRAVRGRVTQSLAMECHLTMYVTVAPASGDPHRDAAYVADVLRRAVAAVTVAPPSADTSPLQRMPHADHRSPDGPPPSPPMDAEYADGRSPRSRDERTRTGSGHDLPVREPHDIDRESRHRGRRRP